MVRQVGLDLKISSQNIPIYETQLVAFIFHFTLRKYFFVGKKPEPLPNVVMILAMTKGLGIMDLWGMK